MPQDDRLGQLALGAGFITKEHLDRALASQKAEEKGNPLGQILVQAQRPSDGAGDLGDLDRVGQAGAVVVALVLDEDLGLVLEAAEGRGVDDPVAVALERRAVGALGLGMEAPPAGAGPGRIGRQSRLVHDAPLVWLPNVDTFMAAPAARGL